MEDKQVLFNNIDKVHTTLSNNIFLMLENKCSNNN